MKTLKTLSFYYRYLILLTAVGYSAACTQLVNKSTYKEHYFHFSQKDYEKSIKAFTRKKEGYRGIYNTFQVWITVMNSPLTESFLKKRASFLKWDKDTFHQENLRASQALSSESKIIISLFTPETSFNDLSQGKKSIWKIYLEAEGERYIGKAKKTSLPRAEQKILFPHHSHFSSLYEVHFDIPMTKVEKNFAWITFTSSLGSAKASFPPSFKKSL